MLDKIVQEAATALEQSNISGEANVTQWVRENCEYRPETEFYIVFLLCCELADRDARRNGYKDQFDRAASLAFSST